MAEVTFELRSPADEWMPAGVLGETDPLGSVSSYERTGRQIIIFGWWERRPGVWRSTVGADVANVVYRAVYSFGLERLADLAEGPYERDVWTVRGKVRARWTLVS